MQFTPKNSAAALYAPSKAVVAGGEAGQLRARRVCERLAVINLDSSQQLNKPVSCKERIFGVHCVSVPVANKMHTRGKEQQCI
eukprot:1144732-Pelagomonas_calceolata.AAC.1